MVELLQLKLRLRLLGDGLSLCFLMVPLLVTRSAADNAAFDISFIALGPLTPAVPIAEGPT
jgi:hypothetical protein